MSDQQVNSPADVTFNEGLAELEGVIRALEGGQLELEESLVQYERGVGLLRALQGRAHEVYTGVTLIKKEKGEDGKETCQTVQFHSMTTVHVHSMSDAEIERYMDTGDPFDKAGSYGIQGPFAAFVDGIEGDYHTVMGLPVAKVYQELKKLRQQAG